MRAVTISSLVMLLLAPVWPAAAAPVQIGLSASADIQPPLATRPMEQRRFDFEEPSTGTVPFAWEAVSGAALYQVQVSAEKDFSELKNPAQQFVLGGDTTEAQITGLPEGAYYWRIAAIDREGRRSAWSRQRGFSVNEGPPPAAGDGPSLTIASTTPAGIKCIVRGITSADGRLEIWVNGVPGGDVPIGEGGEFSALVDANQIGKNKIRLIAIDRSGSTAVAETSFHYHGG